jgi:hypothetical protein
MPQTHAICVITAWQNSNADNHKAAVDALLDEVVANALIAESAMEMAA